MQTLIKCEHKIERDGDDYTVVELQTVSIGNRTRKRKVHCGYFHSFDAAADYMYFTFGRERYVSN